jgi:SAM-dependent methyltransferase
MLDVMGLHASSRGRLLDVGCGNGAFLAKMRDLGWEVVGVKPDPEAARVAREDFGVTVFEGRLEEAGLSDGSLDTITMHHVIEHISDPVDVLRECYRILKPSGILVIVTPNLNALGRHLMGMSWRGWEVPRHFTLYLRRALSGPVWKRLDFTCEHCEPLYGRPGGSGQPVGSWASLTKYLSVRLVSRGGV